MGINFPYFRCYNSHVNKIILFLIFTFYSSNAFSFDKNEIVLGDILSESQLKEIKDLHRGLEHFSHIPFNKPGIYTDVYAWYNDTGKKTIHVLPGSNQVVWHTIEITDIECFKFLELYKPRNLTSKNITLDIFKDGNTAGAHWTKWSEEAKFNVYVIDNLKNYFADEEKTKSLLPIRDVKCKSKENVTILSEMAHNSIDEQNDYVEYLKYLETFPNITAFGHTLLEPFGDTEIIAELDIGLAAVRVSNPSSFFYKYYLYYVPEAPKKIVRIKGEYEGEHAQDIFFEVKRLLKKKYARQTFIALDNEYSLIAKNSLWQINLFMDLKNSNRLTIEYISKDTKINYLRDELIDAIKSDSL